MKGEAVPQDNNGTIVIRLSIVISFMLRLPILSFKYITPNLEHPF